MIDFIVEEIEFELVNSTKIKEWIIDAAKDHDHAIDQLSYIFCSDEYLLKVNQEHLKHDYYTDIITFPYSYEDLAADLFISIDRIRDNSDSLKIPFEEELHRVIIHGVLHLLGYDDKSEDDKVVMRLKEDHYIAQL